MLSRKPGRRYRSRVISWLPSWRSMVLLSETTILVCRSGWITAFRGQGTGVGAAIRTARYQPKAQMIAAAIAAQNSTSRIAIRQVFLLAAGAAEAGGGGSFASGSEL